MYAALFSWLAVRESGDGGNSIKLHLYCWRQRFNTVFTHCVSVDIQCGDVLHVTYAGQALSFQ